MPGLLTGLVSIRACSELMQLTIHKSKPAMYFLLESVGGVGNHVDHPQSSRIGNNIISRKA